MSDLRPFRCRLGCHDWRYCMVVGHYPMHKYCAWCGRGDCVVWCRRMMRVEGRKA